MYVLAQWQTNKSGHKMMLFTTGVKDVSCSVRFDETGQVHRVELFRGPIDPEPRGWDVQAPTLRVEDIAQHLVEDHLEHSDWFGVLRGRFPF